MRFLHFLKNSFFSQSQKVLIVETQLKAFTGDFKNRYNKKILPEKYWRGKERFF